LQEEFCHRLQESRSVIVLSPSALSFDIEKAPDNLQLKLIDLRGITEVSSFPQNPSKYFWWLSDLKYDHLKDSGRKIFAKFVNKSPLS
jgi:hypothetical protein